MIVVNVAAWHRLMDTGVGGAGCHWFTDCSHHSWRSRDWVHTIGGVRHTKSASTLSHRWSTPSTPGVTRGCTEQKEAIGGVIVDKNVADCVAGCVVAV